MHLQNKTSMHVFIIFSAVAKDHGAGRPLSTNAKRVPKTSLRDPKKGQDFYSFFYSIRNAFCIQRILLLSIVNQPICCASFMWRGPLQIQLVSWRGATFKMAAAVCASEVKPCSVCSMVDECSGEPELFPTRKKSWHSSIFLFFPPTF